MRKVKCEPGSAEGGITTRLDQMEVYYGLYEGADTRVRIRFINTTCDLDIELNLTMSNATSLRNAIDKVLKEIKAVERS